MNERVPGIFWKGLAVLLYIISAATAFAALYALSVRTTLAAIESAFGTFVILILLLVFARKCWDKGRGNAQGGSVPPRSSSDKRL